MAATSSGSGGTQRLTSLEPGQVIVFGGDRTTVVPAELADAFCDGDRLVVDPTSGDLLHITAAEHEIATTAVGSAVRAFSALADCSDHQIGSFFERFADLLADDDAFAPIARANAADVERARERGRSTTRLELSAGMRDGMIDGLRGWAGSAASRDVLDRRIEHDRWSVESRRAPLGVVGFVFEGRPNVFADAVGVVRTGNTVVFRIGSDALGTAQAIVRQALEPALAAAGLPSGTVGLVDSASRAAGLALFSDSRLSLAVARGSGPAVAQLGAVARQAGVPVSLHGTGGAWLVAGADADRTAFTAIVANSLDRKVCNTLNVCCIVRERAADLVPALIEGLCLAGERRGTGARLHVTDDAAEFAPGDLFERRSLVLRAGGASDEPFASRLELDGLAHEWEWEDSPEVSLHVVESVAEAVGLCNRYSPHFVASLVSGSADEHDRFFATVDAPFVGDGFTRWVDGQYALDAPELGLSNWEGGRMLGRGAILSGQSVHTVRYRARMHDADIRR